MAKAIKKAAPKKKIANKPAKKIAAPKAGELSAKAFTAKLMLLQSDKELEKIQRYFKSGKGEYGEGDQFIGVRMGSLFNLAKEFIDMPVAEIEKLMESPVHELRAGAMSIMGKRGAHKKTTPAQLKELFDLYIRRHDRINNWDLVDLAAYYVVGPYLLDKPRTILYKLAKSKNMWERRTAILSTWAFTLRGDPSETFRIAEMLVHDPEDLVNKATGWMLRTTSGKSKPQLLQFLDKYAATMPRTLLRYSIEKLDKKQKDYYMGLKQVKK